jgi:hypothetical protein
MLRTTTAGLLLSLLAACERPKTRSPGAIAEPELSVSALGVESASAPALPLDSAAPSASATASSATPTAGSSSTLVTSSPSAWSSPEDNTYEAVRESGNLVIHVYVPLCHNDQVDCGSSLAGKPDNLKHNLYWGAVFGQKRFFSRKSSKWSEVAIEKGSGNVLERAVYRRSFPGEPWGREAPITAWVVFDALHGDAIDEAIDGLYREAASGGVLKLNDGEERALPVNVVGYAGHNRMMDGKKPPTTESSAPIPSFVFACYSRSYFEDELKQRGSTLLLSTRALMAPEGYAVDGLVTALAENAPRAELRQAAAKAYATWQKISLETALRIF